MKYFFRSKLGVVGSIIVLIVVIVSVLAPLISPYNVNTFSQDQLSPPSLVHLLGTDSFGRDLFSLILWGGLNTLLFAILTLTFSAAIGISWGLIAGYSGGIIDTLLSRAIDVMMSFPAMIIALLIIATLGTAGKIPLMLAIAATLSPRFARVIYGSTIPFRQNDFILAAKALGAREMRIILMHVLPNLAGPIIVLCSIFMPYVIILESSLSFLGLGVPPDFPTWGRIIADGRKYFQLAPWLTFFPGGAIMLSAIGFNLLGDGLRDVLDPRFAGKLDMKSR